MWWESKNPGSSQPGWKDTGPKHTISSQTGSNHRHCSRASFQIQVRKNCSSFPKLKQ